MAGRTLWWSTSLVLTAAIVGCSTVAGTGTQEAPAVPPAAAEPVTAPDGEPKLPNVELTGPLLYEIVAAEVAAQRGDLGRAYATLMQAARETRDPRLARRATEIALSARAAPQALDAATLWRQLAPGQTDAEQSYAALLVANGRYEEARPLLAREVSADGDPVGSLAHLQHMLARAPDRAKGLELLDALAKPYLNDPKSAFDIRLILAHGAHSAGQFERAAAEARRALALRPDSEQAAIAAAQFLTDRDTKPQHDGRSDALQLLSGFLQRNPNASDARMAYARLLVGDGKMDEARRQFEELLRRDENNPDPLFALGVLALDAELYEDARGFFKRYLAAIDAGAERDPEPVYLNMARIAEDERQYPEALDWLDRVRSGEQQVAARERKAFVLAKMNQVEDALKLLQSTSAATAEERTQLILAQGQILRDAHRYQESYELLDKALQASPDDTGLLYESAMAAERLDRIDVMEAHLRRILQLRPDYAHAYNALGYTLADRNIRLKEAYELIDKALQLAPDDGFILDSMGWVQFRLGNLKAARDYLSRAFRLKPEADVAAHLGEVMWQMGEHDAAREVFRQAQKKEADNETLKETMQRLQVRP